MVRQVRRALGTREVGHTGTLDPFASGLLVALVGRATRLARFVEAADKTYLATAQLGVATDTDDLTGTVMGTADATALHRLSDREIADGLAGLVGHQLQRPPAYSAKHVAGERSYRLARRGKAVELAPVAITVHRIELVGRSGASVTFRAAVSAGTYVRALARDLGAALGVGGHLTSLRREAIGDLRVEDAVPVEQIGPAALRPPAAVLGHLPTRQLDAAARNDVVHGRPIARQGEDGSLVMLLQDGALVALAEPRDQWLQPRVVLEPA